ncbi:MAG: transposase [bacterium]
MNCPQLAAFKVPLDSKKCDDYRFSYHSCKNRSCPKCGNDTTSTWLGKQSGLLLPGQHYLVTATLPQELRPAARSNQKLVYGLLMRCCAEAIQKLARDPKWVGGEVGILAVLQTWARDMHYHPHVHCIVTGGGLAADGKTWRPAQRDYLMPHKALATIFRAKFRDALKRKDPQLFAQVPKTVWRKNWVIDIRPAGTGKTALKYLAPYIFRIAISNKRIIKFENNQVTFRYQDNKGKWHSRTLKAEAFIARFLQHVLPKRLQKVRYYGLFSSRKRHMLARVKELFNMAPDEEQASAASTAEHVMRCPKCGEVMLFVREISPQKTRAP